MPREGCLSPTGKAEGACARINKFKKHGFDMLTCQTVLFELHAAMQHILLFSKWGEFTGSGKNGTYAKC